MPVRMKDIARDLGISIVTVSKVLRNHSDIGSETRERVMKRVKELNYRPNAMARSLVTGRSSLVGLVVPDLLHPFFAEIAMGLSAYLRRKDYCVILASTEEQPELEEAEIEKLLAHRLDALVVAPSRSTPDLFKRVQEQGTPLVLIDRYFHGFRSNFVGSDDYAVGAMATEHLIDIGCRRIAHIRGANNSVGNSRFQGYKATLEKFGIPFHAEDVVQLDSVDVESRRGGAEAMKKFLANRRPPDGLFCINDMAAIGALDMILAKGWQVPKDIAVVGCGNLHYVDTLRIPLTSIDNNSRRIGERTGKLLLAILAEKGPSRPRKIVIPPQLVVRDTTKRSPGNRSRLRTKA